MTSFEKKRMNKLFGEKLSVAKTDASEPQISRNMNPCGPSNRQPHLSKPPKAKLYEDYNYI